MNIQPHPILTKKRPFDILSAGFAACILGLANTSAALVTFDLSVPFPQSVDTDTAAQPIVFTDASTGLQLSVTGHTVAGSGADAPLTITGGRRLNQTVSGVGVNGPGIEGNQLDGLGEDEMVRLLFSSTVTIQSVIFGDASGIGVGTDQFDLGIGPDADDSMVVDVDVPSTFGSDVLTNFPAVPGLPPLDHQVDFPAMVSFDPPGPNNHFSGAPSGRNIQFYTTDFNDDYRIRSITVDFQTGPAAVPEPSFAWAGIGLGMIAALRRKRRRGN